MLIHSTFILLLTSFQLYAQSSDEVNLAISRVKQYLQQFSGRTANDGAQWLENSAKIGAGYDFVAGSPVCYSGACQMEGFRLSLFKLNFTKHPEGTCTTKLIPQNVDLDCLSSTQITAVTESISTLDELKESTKKGIEFSGSIGIFGNSFSYSHSTETRSMIDTIVEKKSTIYFTRATISQIRLFAFEPLLELSEQFRFVIDNMPCCNESNELVEYIQKSITENFGLAYVKDLLLGGIAQQKIIVSEENQKNLQENGFTVTNQAELKVAAASIFSASAKLSMTDEFDQTKLNTFKRFSEQSNVITLGGATTMQSIEEWSKTISSNPTIIKFSISSILDLLTTRRFPNDRNITLKKNLIDKVQKKYIASSLFCYNNCSQKGSCQPTGSFGFGQCQCNSGWSGPDCSIDTRAPSGLLTDISAGDRCSAGYTYRSYDMGALNSQRTARRNLKGCALIVENATVGSVGTFCGIAFSSLNIPCDNFNPHSEPCPLGYSEYSWITEEDNAITIFTCQKTNASINDPPGTLCGFHSSFDSDNEVTCRGYYPGHGKCPPGYPLHQGTFSDSSGSQGTLSLCAKT